MPTHTHGSNWNANSAATTNLIALNSSTATKISDVNIDRVMIAFSNGSAFDIWLKPQPASVDDLKQGILLPKNSGHILIDRDNGYTGEWSAIANADSPDICVVEW